MVALRATVLMIKKAPALPLKGAGAVERRMAETILGYQGTTPK